MYIYILRCSDNSLYTGIASDLNRRLRQHLGIIKGGAKYTKSHRVISVEAVWYSDSRTPARKLEYAVKSLTHEQKESLINSPQSVTKKYFRNLSDFKYEYINSGEFIIQ